VVGDSLSSQGREAMRWSAAGGIEGLGMFDGNAFNVANAASFDGSVIVGVTVDPGVGGQALRWTAETGLVGIGGYGALGVSGDGEVIVGFEDARWVGGTGPQSFGQLADGTVMVFARDTSSDGSVVVGEANGERIALWTAIDGLSVLGQGAAWGVSADGTVMVGRLDDFSGHQEAFLWSEAGGFFPLGRLPGTLNSYANAVSADGSVVVGRSDRTPFIWTEESGMQDLQALLESQSGIDLSGWNLWDARDISYDGRTIVGVGTNPDRDTEGWVVVIPEPCTGLLLAAGLAGIASWRRSGILRRPATARLTAS